MAKPTQLPEWASDGAAIVTPEPSAGKKAAGFIPDERPPANWWNWLFKRIWQWCAYLDGLHNETEFLNKNYTWSGQHYLSGVELGYNPQRTRVVRVPTFGITHNEDNNTPPTQVRLQGSPLVVTMRGGSGNAAIGHVGFSLPQDCVVVDWRAAVEPNASDLTVTLIGTDSNVAGVGSTITLGSLQTAVGGTGPTILSPPTFSFTVTGTQQFVFTINAGTDSTGDAKLYWLEVTYHEVRATGSH